MKDDDDLISAMYGRDDNDTPEDDAPRVQPPQLRYAGKATVVSVNGAQVVIPKIEYVQLLESRLAEFEKRLGEQQTTIKKLTFALTRSNIAAVARSAIKDKRQ